MVLVRSKSDVPLAWVPYDLNIGPMANYRDSFYAAASTHSAIFSMDTGNSDSGGAIPWHWTSRDESFDRPFQRKRLLELIPAYRRGSADSVVIGYSNDSGATWSEKTVDMSGSGRSSTRLHTDKWGRDIRFRVSDNSAGETATLLGIHAIVRPSPLRE
jgi:hypothetical protein